jgi:Carboxypeptidase regulatory-like domain
LHERGIKRLKALVADVSHSGGIMFHFDSKNTPNRPRLQQYVLSWAFVAITILGLSTTVARAQFRASIQGTVTDPEGEVIPGATLTLTDTDTNHVVAAVSNGSGVYNFNALAPDHYTLTIEAAGFQKQVIQNVRITPEQSNAIDVKLALGQTTTSVTVSGDAVASLDTETASLNGSVDSNQIQHLPSAGRDVFQLAQLAPGSFADGAQSAGGGSNSLPGTQGPGGSGSNGIFATENGPQTLAGGGQYETNGISIDGISTSSAVWGGTSVITPSEDSVGSVKILSNGYDAENGRFSGAQIQVTSKSGTNDFHGSLFFRASRPGLNAYQSYNGPTSVQPGTPADRGLIRNEQRFNQFGGSVGGPIWKDHIFAFFAYETQRNNSATTGTNWYETSAFAALAPANSISSTFLNFPGSTVSSSGQINVNCGNAGLVEGVNCRTIPGQGLNIGSPITTGLGKQDLTWTSAGNPGVGGGLADIADIAEYTTVNPTQTVGDQYNGRIDADATKKDHIAFAIYWVPLSVTNYTGSIRPYNLYHHDQINDAFSVIWNHIFSPTFLNEARANAAGWRWNEINSNPQEPFGLPQDNIDAIGSIQASNLGNFGAPGPSVLNQWTYSYKDVATKILGNHTVKFGGEATRLYYLNEATGSARPTYNFYNYWDFLNDAPHSEQGQFNPLTGLPTANRQDDRETIYGFFIQDDWKARPNLTFNVGLRYSYFGPLSAKQNTLTSVRFGTGSANLTGLTIQRGGNLWNAEKGNFGPVFGFAWSPAQFRDRVVVRGGYALSYNQEEIAVSSNGGNNPGLTVFPSFSSGSPAEINPNIQYSIASDPKSLFGYPANPNTISSFNSANLPIGGNTTLNAVPTDLPTAYSHHYSFDTQIDLGHQMIATVGYQGSTSHHLISQLNYYVYAAGQGIAFNPLVTGINLFSNQAGGNYNALLVGFKHNMAHNFMLNADFTYAKSMDNASGPYENDPYPYNPTLSYGRSDYNFGKALKIYGLWQPVLFHGGHQWLEKVVGGWSISGIYNIHTGFPWTPQFNSSTYYYANSGYGTVRPAAYNGQGGRHTSNSAFESGPTASGGGVNVNFPQGALAYFTPPPPGVTPAFPDLGTFPTPGIARNSFDGPGYKDLDATLAKAFGLPKAKVIGENANIEIRADFFNLFNNVNLNPNSVSNNINATNFGQAQSALSGRTINLQARFSF